MKRFDITTNDSNQRLDKFLNKAVPLLPKSLMHKFIRLKRIKVNGKRSDPSLKLNEGDVLELYINDEFFDKGSRSGTLPMPEKTFSIIYEDANIMLVDKPAGLVVHEDDKTSYNTLINQVKAYLYKKGEWNYEVENSFSPALCNRIDRNTSGIVMVAKTATALRCLNQRIKDREVQKKYTCITIGSPPKDEGKINTFILKDSDKNEVSVHTTDVRGSKKAITLYRVIKRSDKLSLVECELITGRTHQIRAHMAFIGCPILGDGKYGRNHINKSYKRYSQALCASHVSFRFSENIDELSYLNNKSFSVRHIEFQELIDF